MLSAVEELPNNKYDIILNLEVIEHVNNQKLFISKSCELVNHGGLMFVATINKTIFSHDNFCFSSWNNSGFKSDF